MSADITTVICARNAAGTIARAVRSALGQSREVVLVDDWSADGTAEIAREAAPEGLRIVRPQEHRTLGFARSIGVGSVGTEWLVWLDADDEFNPERVNHLVDRAIAEGLDAVWDAAELFDGASGERVRGLPMPEFMLRPGAAARLFERNFIPGPAWPLVRTCIARQIGYDPVLPTADDMDFMLRALLAGCRMGFIANCGYRQFAYGDSLSRRLAHQRHWLAQVLRRHDYEVARASYTRAGYGGRVGWWGLVSMALFRNEPKEALRFLDEAAPPGADPNEVLEPEGPWPFREGWRRAFQRGTCLALIGASDEEAVEELLRARFMEVTAEGENNLGVVLERLGRTAEARSCFEEALRRFPGYLDARLNLEDPRGGRITTHPLRRQASRSEY